jgi:hypothetical protein
MGGSPKAPPAPKTPADYQPEIAAKRTELQNKLNQQALDYNASVKSFNDSLTGLSNQYKTAHNNLDALDIKSVDDYGKAYNTTYNDLLSSLGGMTKPSDFKFTSTYSLPEYANATIQLENPTLSSINNDLYSGLNNNISNDISTLKGLMGQRTTAEKNYSKFFDSLNANLTPAISNANALNLGSYASAGFDKSPLSNLQSQLANFSSDIKGDYTYAPETSATSALNTLAQRYAALDTEKANETKRNTDYRTGLEDFLNTSRTALGGYNITNEDKLNALSKSLEDKYYEASHYKSPLSVDFSGLLNEGSGLKSNVASLLNQRKDEQNRIAAAQKNYTNLANTYAGQAGNSSMYNLQSLTDLANNINNQRSDISGFSSLLDTDFSGAIKSLGEAETSLAAIKKQRADELARLQAESSKFSSGLMDIPLYNESDFTSRLDKENALLSELGMFTGGDVNPYKTNITANRRAVQDRLQQLADYRNTIEGDAKTLMKKFNDQSFYDTDSVNAATSGDYKKLFDLAQLYNSSQSGDELTSIKGRLDSELKRLEADAAARDAIAKKEAGSVGSVIGANQVYTVNGIPLTAEEYAALLKKKQQEEASSTMSSAFKTALGIG